MRFGFLWKNILVERLVEKQDHSPEEKGASCRAWHESSGWENLGFPIICSEHIGQQFGFHNFARRQGPDQLPLASDVDVVACVKAQQEIIKRYKDLLETNQKSNEKHSMSTWYVRYEPWTNSKASKPIVTQNHYIASWQAITCASVEKLMGWET